MLINVDLKIQASVLALRIRDFLSSLLHPLQACTVPAHRMSFLGFLTSEDDAYTASQRTRALRASSLL